MAGALGPVSNSRSAARASSARPTLASQRGDSGRLRRISITTRAPTEPITNRIRHPGMPKRLCSVNPRDMNPSTGTATKEQVYAHAASRPRCSFGSTSDRYASATGYSAPTPTPAMNRVTTRNHGVGENAPMSVQTENQIRLNRNARRRPIRSARCPSVAEPMNMPRNVDARSSFSSVPPRWYCAFSVVLMVLDRKIS